VSAVVPVGPAANQQITLDGTPLGSAIAIRSSYPTIQFVGGVYHMWVQVQDEGTAADLRIAGYRHATSPDGVAFTTAGTLSFAGDPFAATLYGSTFGEPPWIYPRATLSGGGVTFQFWTYNTPPDVTGDYNYDLSINAIAAVGDLALTHFGPVGPIAGGIPGQTAGGWGIVGGNMYYDNNSSLGRAALVLSGPGPFPATAGTGPWFATATNAAVFDPLTPLGYVACHLPGGNTYIHNGARVIDNGDGSLGFFFTLRNCDGSRKDNQVYYAESVDNGDSFGAPVGIYPGGVTIGGAAVGSGFSLADVVVSGGQRVIYFNAFDDSNHLIVGAAPPPLRIRTAAKPVPASSPASLALLALMMAAAALLRRRRATR
jgi:MYXO-CTERM domain-containing protein